MPVRKYGIYLAYGPIKNFTAEGLGRHLGEFLKAAQDLDDVEFVIAAPSWFREPYEELREEFNLREDAFKLLIPENPPLLWVGYSWLDRLKKRLDARRRRGSRPARIGLRAKVSRWGKSQIRRLVGVRSLWVLLALLPLALVALPFVTVMLLIWLVGKLLRRLLPQRFISPTRWRGKISKVAHVAGSIVGALRGRVYKAMQDAESRYLSELANKQDDVLAWYTPSAFWPNFNLIAAPKVICIPDVVFSEFPLPFASEQEGGDRLRTTFDAIADIIESGDHFITYSVEIRNTTLGEKFGVPTSKVTVIPHGANRLDRYITVTGFTDNDKASLITSQQYLAAALGKCLNNASAPRLAFGEPAFLFYASQFRPNKNVQTLLKAYAFLRRERGLSLKLILTGDPRHSPLGRFLKENDLDDDVLCLRGLTQKELAACYKLAHLAVNPSLAEGAMPFTLTEAISVGTPAIMGDIPVTSEIITREHLREAILFDPYDWRELAAKIEWALKNRNDLLKLETDFYDEELVKRSWSVVVREYVAALDLAASKGKPDGSLGHGR
ncbi:glycosyltransferase [Aliihoeflea aestuarii]|jgi:glycosyltransferase involved in cell wall biosynthesis|uniref:glycosyltransferase n=1 Tax=Aliihoeflea aestuarii TaxID=453840 RepID=UPI0020925755|nr:glycosyltransferase [Aliihoeflea aestuarii]MCO6391111.1 glycosyltransferase [Aliihoeflea aestuarii]